MSLAAPVTRPAAARPGLVDLGPVAQLRAGRLARRLPQLYLGLVLYGVSLAAMVRGDLGLAPWDVLHSGLTGYVPLSLGQVLIVVSFLVMLLWIPLREQPGLGTVSNAVVVGLSADVTLALLDRPDPLVPRVALAASRRRPLRPGLGALHRRPARPRPPRRADDRPRPPHRPLPAPGPHRPRGPRGRPRPPPRRRRRSRAPSPTPSSSAPSPSSSSRTSRSRSVSRPGRPARRPEVGHGPPASGGSGRRACCTVPSGDAPARAPTSALDSPSRDQPGAPRARGR